MPRFLDIVRQFTSGAAHLDVAHGAAGAVAVTLTIGCRVAQAGLYAPSAMAWSDRLSSVLAQTGISSALVQLIARI